jgi:hypothetical protein
MPNFRLSTSRFERCSFRGTKISGWRSKCAEFVDCFFGATIRNSIFYGRPNGCYEEIDKANAIRDSDRILFRTDQVSEAEFQREAPRRTINEFRGNDFSEADFDYVDLRNGIDVSAQRWPEDKGYVRLDKWPARLITARRRLDSLPESTSRSNALALLDIMSSDGRDTETEKILTPAWATMNLSRGGAWELLLGALDEVDGAGDIHQR